MPERFDWRSPRAAEELMRLSQEQFASEFLRRNPAYREDYHNTQHGIVLGTLSYQDGMRALARRWGLSFPARTG